MVGTAKALKQLIGNQPVGALACARDLLEASLLRLSAGATSPHMQIIVLRVLSPVTEPAMQLQRQVWAA